MCKILINKNKSIYVDVKDILSIIYNKKVIVNLINWKEIISDRRWIELLNDFNCLRKGGNINNMGKKKPVKKGTKKGQ